MDGACPGRGAGPRWAGAKVARTPKSRTYSLRMPRRVCVVTGSRADFGYLIEPMRRLALDPLFELQTVVCAAHLSPVHGNTSQNIADAGFSIDARVDMLLVGDTPAAVTKSVGLGVIGFADAFERLRPELLMVLGDRYETLAAATAGVLANIPVAHLAGGDVTEGAVDEQLRHAITKLSHLHFVTHEAAAERVLQMGEGPDRVFCVGSTSLDVLLSMTRLSKEQAFSAAGLVPGRRNIVLAFHPETLARVPASEQLEAVLAGVTSFGDDLGIVIVAANADAEGGRINAALQSFAAVRRNIVYCPSLPHVVYLSLLSHADALVGNSSSGFYEAPSLGLATVNVGDRQRGRARAASVFDCPAEPGAIVETLARAFAFDARGVINPYGDGRASDRIIRVLRSIDDPRALLQKRFWRWDGFQHAAAA